LKREFDCSEITGMNLKAYKMQNLLYLNAEKSIGGDKESFRFWKNEKMNEKI